MRKSHWGTILHFVRACWLPRSLQGAQAALEARNARCKSGTVRQSADEEDASERVKDRLEQAERAVEKFVSRRLKAVQPGLQKVDWPSLRPIGLRMGMPVRWPLRNAHLSRKEHSATPRPFHCCGQCQSCIPRAGSAQGQACPYTMRQLEADRLPLTSHARLHHNEVPSTLSRRRRRQSVRWWGASAAGRTTPKACGTV